MLTQTGKAWFCVFNLEVMLVLALAGEEFSSSVIKLYLGACLHRFPHSMIQALQNTVTTPFACMHISFSQARWTDGTTTCNAVHGITQGPAGSIPVLCPCGDQQHAISTSSTPYHQASSTSVAVCATIYKLVEQVISDYCNTGTGS